MSSKATTEPVEPVVTEVEADKKKVEIDEKEKQRVFEIDNKKFLVEYDGKQHFKKVNFWRESSNLERTKLHDDMNDAF